MRIVNKTKWCTEDLRRVFVKCCEVRGVDQSRYVVEVVSARGRALHGLGSYTRPWVRMKVPPKFERFGAVGEVVEVLDHLPEWAMESLAKIFLHEVDHTLGLQHRDMADLWEFTVDWVKEYSVGREPVKEKPKVDLVVKRSEHAQKMLARHQKVLKRTQTLVSKWKAKVRYYETALVRKAAASQLPPVERKPRVPKPKSLVSLLKDAVRQAYGPVKIEVGLRENAAGEVVADAREWTEDSDVVDIVRPKDAKLVPNMDLDLYLYRGGEFVTNATAEIRDGQVSVKP
jgi:hypothetical protein